MLFAVRCSLRGVLPFSFLVFEEELPSNRGLNFPQPPPPPHPSSACPGRGGKVVYKVTLPCPHPLHTDILVFVCCLVRVVDAGWLPLLFVESRRLVCRRLPLHRLFRQSSAVLYQRCIMRVDDVGHFMLIRLLVRHLIHPV